MLRPQRFKNRSRITRHSTLEQLEYRELLTGDPIVAQFVATNSSTLADKDGESTPWIKAQDTTENESSLSSEASGDNAKTLDKFVSPDVSSLGKNQPPTNSTPAVANFHGAQLIVADTTFSVDRGFFSEPFSVVIASETPGAKLRYTTDGSDPTLRSGIPYAGPIIIDTTIILRAVATKAEYVSSNVDTQTYIFLEDVIRQDGAGLPNNWGHSGADYAVDPDVVFDPAYADSIIDDLKSIPTLSLATDVNNWFGPNGQGIYLQGQGIERPVSAELIIPDGSEGFQINAAVQIQGGSSTNRWKADKLSMRLKFKAPYGPTKLDYRFFADSNVSEFNTLVLDATLNLGYVHPSHNQRVRSQYIRDQFVSDLQNELGGFAPHGRFVHLYINGLYWGMYGVHERPDESFAESYLGGKTEDYDIIKHAAGNVVNGNNLAYEQLLSAARTDLSVSRNYNNIQNLLDIPNFIDYMLLNFYVGNEDWAHQNWYASRNRISPEGKWRFHSWDAEHVLKSVTQNSTGKNDSGGPTEIHQQLINNPEYRLLFADHAQKQLLNNGLFTPDSAISVYTNRLNEIDRAIVAESARWGDNRRPDQPYTRDKEWVAERDWLLNTYFPQRTSITLDQIIAKGLYPSVAPPVFNQHGGEVASGFELLMSEGGGDVYFTTDGSDPRLPGGAVSSTATLFQGNTTSNTLIPTGDTWNYLDTGTEAPSDWNTAGFDDGDWKSGDAQLGYGDSDENTVVDFGPDPSNKFTTTYFRREFNVDNTDDISKLSLRLLRDDGAVVYINGQEVVRSNMPSGVIDFATRAASTVGGAAESTFFSFDISPLFLQQGTNVLSVEIHQTNATSSDISFDASLEAITTQSGDAISIESRTTVKARALNAGTWSALNEATFTLNKDATAGDISITEINYNPRKPSESELAVNPAWTNVNFEFIELRNTTNETIDLNGLQFTDGVTFDFSTSDVTSLDPDEYVLVVADKNAFESRYGAANIAGEFTGKLSDKGEAIILLDVQGQAVHDFSYNDSGNWPGRADGKGSTLEIVDTTGDYNSSQNWRSSTEFGGTPGQTSVGPVSDIVINEVLAHTDLPQRDSIELYNTSDVDIDISGWYISDSSSNYIKYQIPSGTILSANGYIVFDESQFNPTPQTPSPENFALNSAHGDDVWLLAADDQGQLTRFVDHVDFGASANSESFGRFPNGTGKLTPMDNLTLGGPNSVPRVGPVVITEIMYNPLPFGAIQGSLLEFVEIYNPTESVINLTGWQLGSGINYVFTTGLQLSAGEALVVVPFDPSDPLNSQLLTDFRTAYNIDNPVQIVGPFTGQLNNGGDRVRLFFPDEPPVTEPDFNPLLLSDEVSYDDSSPWPEQADGFGESLTRVAASGWGNAPASWLSAAPTPGAFQQSGGLPGDANGDGQVDLADFNVLKSTFGQFGLNLPGDLNKDGQVGLADFSILKDNFGTSAALQLATPLSRSTTTSPETERHAAIDTALTDINDLFTWYDSSDKDEEEDLFLL